MSKLKETIYTPSIRDLLPDIELMVLEVQSKLEDALEEIETTKEKGVLCMSTYAFITMNIGLDFDVLMRVDKIYGIEPTKKNKITMVHHHNGTYAVNEDYLSFVTRFYETVEELEEGVEE